MTTLVVGANGATGRLLVRELLQRGESVRAVVRESAALPEGLANHAGLSVIRATLLEWSDDELAELVEGCDAVASCLGHNLSVKGMWGQPRRLVTEATRRLCRALSRSTSERRAKLVLMNTTGNRNRDLDERISFAQACVVALIRRLVPPHADNEEAAEYLRSEIGQAHERIEWAVVRPDGLVDEDEVSAYETHPSPTRSAIFDAGKTSRINVAHFMASLVTDEELWRRWRGQMPVLYNQR